MRWMELSSLYIFLCVRGFCVLIFLHLFWTEHLCIAYFLIISFDATFVAFFFTTLLKLAFVVILLHLWFLLFLLYVHSIRALHMFFCCFDCQEGKKTPIYFCIRYIFHRRCSYILSCWCISRCFCLFIHCFSSCFFLVRMCTALTKTPAVMECFWFCVHFTRWLFAWFYVFQFWWFDLRSLKTFTSDRNEKRD